MSSVSRVLVFLFVLSAASAFASSPELRVCADPNNLPYSNQQQQGFENALAELVAHDLGMKVAYFWYPQRHKFFQQTLQAGNCDVVMGVPAGIRVAETTTPYYRSSYVFVSPSKRDFRIASFDDPRLHNLRIGVHITGDGDDRMPTTAALLKRGLARNLVGYSLFGRLSEQNPAADLIRAVSDDAVDVAVVWGPLGGYFAEHSAVPLDVTPVCSASADASIPLTFQIAMGVRVGNDTLRDKLNDVIARHQPEIHRLLVSYGVPLVDGRERLCQ